MTTIDRTALAQVVGAAGSGSGDSPSGKGGGGQLSLGHIQQAMSGRAGSPIMDVPTALPQPPHHAE